MCGWNDDFLMQVHGTKGTECALALASPPVSPRAVAAILMIQKSNVTKVTLLSDVVADVFITGRCDKCFVSEM